MNVLGDLLTRDRRSDAPALVAPALGREYDYRRFCTLTWKVGNFVRHFGVHTGSTVAIVAPPRPEPIVSFLGVALLGGITQFDPPSDTDARLLITPSPDTNTSDTEYDRPAGRQRIVYGGSADTPATEQFEQGVWSENPTKSPTTVDAERPVLRTNEATYTHADLLGGARSVIDAWELTASDVVAIRSPLREPETVVAGIIAPLVVGGTILLPDTETVGDCAVAETAPETRVLSPEMLAL